MKRVLAVTFTVAIACALLAAPAQATVVIPADLNTLAQEAAAIAHARVVRVEARQGQGRRVERLVTLQVLEYFKGGWGNVVQITLPGGTLGRYRTVTFGAPEVEEGEELVLFLGARADAASPDLTGTAVKPFVLGFHQGMFRVVTDEATGKRLVMPPLIQSDGSADTGTIKRGDPARRPLELGDFQGRIASALAAGRIASKAGASAVARSAR